LDVAYYDDTLLCIVNGDFRVGIDYHPIRSGICFYSDGADAQNRPFHIGCVHQVFTLDISERYEDDIIFSNSIIDTFSTIILGEFRRFCIDE
jgi:hypothetical protein